MTFLDKEATDSNAIAMSSGEKDMRKVPSVGDLVRQQYTQAPFPPVGLFPIVKGSPKKLIWSYSFAEVYYHAFRIYREPAGKRLLDAGCGTGHGIIQIRHQAPGAEVHAFDFSPKSLELAQQRVEAMGGEPVTFHEMDILELTSLPGQFDAIFCSGVVHHTANPIRALIQLKSKLKPDGVLYLMLYSQYGRRETILMQRAIKLMCKDPTDQREGLRVGRQIFDCLPPRNPIVVWERTRWSNNHRKHDEAFIDMYVNANEKDYTIRGVCEDLSAAGLKFLRFTDPHLWHLSGRMKAPSELIERFNALPPLGQYEIMENLFPDHDQYAFVATHEECPVTPPAWLSGGLLAPQEDKLTAMRSPFAKTLGPEPGRPGSTLWAGYFGARARLNKDSIDLLNSCDGRYSVKKIVEVWEQSHPAVAQGKGLLNIHTMEYYGLIYLKEI